MKRRQSRDGEHTFLYSERKKQKMDSSLKSLNNDCLVKIFDHLTMNDLVNIVDSDNHFITAAWDVFSKKFRKTTISISNEVAENETVPQSVKLLKFFGPLIITLTTTYWPRYQRFNKILEDTIIANCRKTVSTMIFVNAYYSIFHGLDEPFESVRNVEFHRGRLNNLTPNFNKLFPRASRLGLKLLKGQKFNDASGSGTNGRRFINHFPALQQFELTNWSGESEGKCDGINYFDIVLLNKFIELNPQLKSLSIIEENPGCDHCCRCLKEFTGSIDEYLPNLENLNLCFDDIYSDEAIQLKFNKLKELTIKFREMDFEMEDVCTITTDELDVLNLIDVDCEGCFDAISTNKQVKNLNISGIDMTPEFIDKMVQLVSTLPRLREFKLETEDFMEMDQISKLLTTCKHLTKLTVEAHCAERVGNETFEKRLNNMMTKIIKNNWQHTITQKSECFGNSCLVKLVFDKIMTVDDGQ